MRVRSAEASLATPVSTPLTTAAPPPRATAEAAPFREVLGRLGKRIDQGERVVNSALSGTASSDPGALIALQAGIYRYVEAVDLAAKLVDKASGGVKTVLQGQ